MCNDKIKPEEKLWLRYTWLRIFKLQKLKFLRKLNRIQLFSGHLVSVVCVLYIIQTYKDMLLWLAMSSAFHPHSAFAIDSWAPSTACCKPAKSLFYVPSDSMAAGGSSLLINADPETGPVGNFTYGFSFPLFSRG